MNRFIPLLLTLMLLCGCAAQNPQPPVPEPASPASAEAPDIRGFYEAGSLTETRTSGALKVFPLPGNTVCGFLPLGDAVLLLAASGTGTELTLLTGDTLIPSHSVSLPFPLTSQDITVTDGGGIAFFDPGTMQIVVLDGCLQEVQHIGVPEDLVGMPLLSSDGNTVYYCTTTAIRTQDLGTGISRIIKEAAYPSQHVSGLFLEDSVLQLHITDQSGANHSLFLCPQTGQLLADRSDLLTFSASEQNYYIQLSGGSAQMYLFGQADDTPRTFLPRTAEHCVFLSSLHGAVSFSHPGNTQTTIDYYDLHSGMRTASLILEETLHPEEIHSASDDSIWFLARNDSQEYTALYRWYPEKSSVQDDRLYTADYYTRQNPDYEGLASCSLYAQDIGQRHGIEVLIYRDAAEMAPWDYDLEYEYMVPVLQKELELLDERLSHYPEGFLQTLAGKFSGIRIRIVRQICGSPESGSTEIAAGIQFWNDYEANIVLAAGHSTGAALYHELCHLIDTVVLTESTAYDQWDALNPAGFQYASSLHHTMHAKDWLQAGWESFLDDYSMSYPKEDRARIMEYAMIPGNADRFESPYLQAKLKLLCTGIREAFDLEDSSEDFLWEQYLHTSLASKT